VYVAFHTIAAWDLCGRVGPAIPTVTTKAFNTLELSTAASYTATTTPKNSDDTTVVENALTESASWWHYSAMDLRTRYGFYTLIYSHT